MKSSVSTPSPPQQPSTADAVNAWVSSMPQVYETQLRYAPLEAQQQLDLAQQYALPMAETYQEAQRALYPETSAIQEELAGQVLEGIDAGIPPELEERYRQRLVQNLGTNVGSPIAADYVSRGLLEQDMQYQNYYRNLGLSLAGRQPLSQPTSPQYSNYMGQFTPNSVMNYTSSNYGNYARTYGDMYNANAGLAGSQNDMMGNIIGSGFGAIGTAIASSIKYKKNVKIWE